MKSKRTKINIARISRSFTYSVQDTCELLGVHKNTVREWFKKGLARTDDRRPHLIHGYELKRFLKQRKQSRRSKCAFHEFYCLRCRVPRTAWDNLADLVQQSDKMLMLSALCSECETPMHKIQSTKNLPKILKTFVLSKPQLKRLSGSTSPSLDCYLIEERQT